MPWHMVRRRFKKTKVEQPRFAAAVRRRVIVTM